MSFAGKSFRVVGLLTGLGLLGSGCGEGVGQLGDEGGDTGSGLTFEEFKAQTYREPESGFYIVDGHIALHDDKELEGFYEQNVRNGQLIVHTVNGVDAKWSATQKLNLTYCVSTTFGTNHTAAVNAMANAAAAWEAAANVNFVYVSAQNSNCTASNTSVLFDVRPVNSGGQYLARAFFPDSSRSGRNVLIDNTAFGNVSPWTLTGILRHELGHTLGFRHEHTRPNAGTCFEDNNWRALTSYDPYSVMHYPQCNGSQTGDLVLTATDKAGAAALYGAPGGGTGGGTTTTQNYSGSVASGQNIYYPAFSVKAGTVFTAAMSGGTGDADLYVRWSAQPTTSTYNCRPYKTGNAETCSLTVPSGVTTAYVMVRGYTAATYNLAVTYTKP
jgi:serine protease